jgi:hypothetical protein
VFRFLFSEPWINLILIVKNIGTPSEACKAKLAQLFPKAEVVLHKASGSEILPGYLIIHSQCAFQFLLVSLTQFAAAGLLGVEC